MRSVEVEVVHYRTDEIAHVAEVLIRNYVKYSNIARVDAWDIYGRILQDGIRKGSPYSFKFQAPGIDVWWSGINPLRPKQKDEKITYEIEEPWFGAFANRITTLPSERTHIEKITRTLFEAMSKDYHLDNTNPGVLKFPKEIYADRYIGPVPIVTQGSL